MADRAIYFVCAYTEYKKKKHTHTKLFDALIIISTIDS